MNDPIQDPKSPSSEALPEQESAASEETSAAPDNGAPAKEPLDLAKELYDWLEVLVSAMTAVLLLFCFVGRLATVEGGSMLPTLTSGEKLIVQRILYEPEQGDIIICQSASYGMETPLIKRIIALEGQTVTIDFENWKVRVDGVELEEDYINFQNGVFMNGWDYGESYTVPEGYVFVMGDNRNNSQDSRRHAVGPIDKRLILGKALVGFSAQDGIRLFD